MTGWQRRERGIAACASQVGVSAGEEERIFVERFGRRFAEEAFQASRGGTCRSPDEPDAGSR